MFQGKAKYLFILFLLTGNWFSIANAMVWKTENHWDETWEKRYQHWVKHNFTEEFFMDEKRPIYYKYEHDCADAIYAARIIFSYENKLPFVIHNPMRKGRTLSNGMTSWDKYKEPKRVRKFLDYIANVTSTRSLRRDTYPIALDDIKPGDIYVAPGVHSYVISNITDAGVAEVISSTTPKAVRYMDKIPSFPFYIPEDYKKYSDGYRRFIQPQNIRKKLKLQPGYNIEQFKIAESVKQDYVKFTDILATALGTRTETPDEKTLRLMIAMCMYANDRAIFVYEALYHLQQLRKKGRKCMTRTEYNNYSTPSRDRRLKAFFLAVKNHYEKNPKYKHWTQPQRWARALFAQNPRPNEVKELNEFCKVQMSLGMEYYIPLRELSQNLFSGRVVSDPHAPIEHRWGIAKTPYKARCKTY